MSISTIQNIPCKFENIDNNLCNVTFTMPVQYLNAFVLMLQSLSTLLKGVGWQAKCEIESNRSRSPERQAEIAQFQEHFESACCEMFTKYLNGGSSSREAFSLTVSMIKKDFPFSSYDIVKKCLTKNKLIKKTGFYASRHKMT